MSLLFYLKREIHEYLIDSEYAIINISNTDYIYDDGMYGTWYVDSGDIKNSMVWERIASSVMMSFYIDTITRIQQW